MSCAVCQNEITTETYEKNECDKIDSKDPSCLRLKCGHAFHATCVLETFRNGFGCPICRESLRNEEEPELLPLFEEDETITRMDLQRNRLRSTNKKIRKARRELKKSTKEYKILCESLKTKRAAVIKTALKDFKKEQFKEYKKLKLTVAKHLTEVKNLELNELAKRNSESDVENYTSFAIEFDYSLYEHLRCLDFFAEDPLSRKFWG